MLRDRLNATWLLSFGQPIAPQWMTDALALGWKHSAERDARQLARRVRPQPEAHMVLWVGREQASLACELLGLLSSTGVKRLAVVLDDALNDSQERRMRWLGVMILPASTTAPAEIQQWLDARSVGRSSDPPSAWRESNPAYREPPRAVAAARR